MEIDTMAKYKLPVVVDRLQQQRVGHVDAARRRIRSALPIHLFQENLRYDKLAEALGGHGEYVTRPAEFRPALERAYQVAAREGRPAVINCQGKKEFWDRAKYPARSDRQDRARRDVVLPLARLRLRPTSMWLRLASAVLPCPHSVRARFSKAA